METATSLPPVVQKDEDDTASETLLTPGASTSYYNATTEALQMDEENDETLNLWEKMQQFEYAKAWTPLCKKYRWAIIGMWLVFWPLGMIYFPKFVDITDSGIDAPSGSPADVADDSECFS